MLSSFHMRKMTEICISLKIEISRRDRPPQRHWFVTFVSTGYLYLCDANVRYTNKVHLLRCDAASFVFRAVRMGIPVKETRRRSEQVRKRGCISGARDVSGTRRESGDQ